MMKPTPERIEWVEKLNEAAGMRFRAPKTRFQEFINLWFRESQWARRLLGGKWEAYVHDLGSCHAVITWHWVTEFHRYPAGGNPVLFRIEDWDNSRGWAV